MAIFTADTPREWREKTGSLSKKLNAEFGLLETLLDGVSRTTNTLTITKATISLVASTKINLTGRIGMGSQGSGIAVTTAAPFGLDLHVKPVTALTAGDTGLSCGLRMRYEVGADQTNQISIIALEGRLRPKKDMGDGCHAAVSGTIEASEGAACVLGGTSTTQRNAGNFCVELGEGVTCTSGWLTGITIDSSTHSGVSMASCTYAGLRIKTSSGKEAWEYGIYLDDASAIKGIHLGSSGGAASATGLLFGIGTLGDPATSATGDDKFIELRCETTATSGDNRLQYMRYYMNGINATGGECLKAGTVLGAAIGTARGEQASIEVSSTGYITGFACGLDSLLEVANSAVPSGGTYCAGQSQIWMTGSSSDLSAAASHAIHRFSVAGGDAGAEAKVLNAFNFDVENCADSGGDEMISPGSSEGGTTGTIRILINGDIRYLAYYSHKGHA